MVSRTKAVRLLILVTLVTLVTLSQGQSGFATRGQEKSAAQGNRTSPANAPADDISGTYSFLKDGEFVQINVDKDGVSGYISRLGESDSDHGEFLDQFFDKASIQGHDVAFTTRPLHGVWYEFKGKYERGPAKSKAEEGYFIVRGTLKEYSLDANRKTVTRSRDVEFKLQRELDEPDEAKPDKRKKSKD